MDDSLLENVLSLYQTLFDHVSILEKKISEQQDIILKLVDDVNKLNEEIELLVNSAFIHGDLHEHRAFHEKKNKKWKFW